MTRCSAVRQFVPSDGQQPVHSRAHRAAKCAFECRFCTTARFCRDLQHQRLTSKWLRVLFGPALAMNRGSVDKERDNMLWTICVILLILWALGMVTSYTMGGFLHILLILAVIVVLIRLFQGRRSVV